MTELTYLTGYPPDLLQQVQRMIDENKLCENMLPAHHQTELDLRLYLTWLQVRDNT